MEKYYDLEEEIKKLENGETTKEELLEGLRKKLLDAMIDGDCLGIYIGN